VKLLAFVRQFWSRRHTDSDPEPPLGDDEDPYAEPVELQISDVIDLHTIPPRQVKAVVEEYLYEAHRRGFRYVRIVHGKGIGVQREIVRGILERTSFVRSYGDAPPEAGGPGATLATLETDHG
jgi:DNA-nicking Smr family endonuclease